MARPGQRGGGSFLGRRRSEAWRWMVVRFRCRLDAHRRHAAVGIAITSVSLAPTGVVTHHGNAWLASSLPARGRFPRALALRATRTPTARHSDTAGLVEENQLVVQIAGRLPEPPTRRRSIRPVPDRQRRCGSLRDGLAATLDPTTPPRLAMLRYEFGASPWLRVYQRSR